MNEKIANLYHWEYNIAIVFGHKKKRNEKEKHTDFVIAKSKFDLCINAYCKIVGEGIFSNILTSCLNTVGALEELYQSQAGEEDYSSECGEVIEQQRAQVLQSKPPPSRPSPSRPPPPRPTPPGSSPSSPALSRTQSQGPKVSTEHFFFYIF